MQHEERKGKPDLAQFPKDDGALRSVNTCVDRGVTSRERSVNQCVNTCFLASSKCVIITLITHLDEARHDTPDTATDAGTFSGRSH